MSLDREYRPIVFDDCLGQAGTTKVLRKTLEDIPNRVEPTIFHGPYGSGKTTLARNYARAILCPNRTVTLDACNTCDSCLMFFAGTHPGYIEINGANITKVDEFRKILDSTVYQAQGSQYRVYLIDECHMMSKASQNLFLKPLEEGIDGVFWLFCTTEYHKIIETIQSRCIDHGIRPIPSELIVQRVKYVCEEQKIPFEEEAIEAVVEVKGHFRDILKFTGQVKDIGGVVADNVFEYLGIGVNDSYFECLIALKDDPATAMQHLRAALAGVSALDAYNGLISASMDAYKAQRRVRCSLVVRNKELRQKLYDTYQDGVTSIANYLITKGARRVDEAYLISTLLLLHRRLQQPMDVEEGTTVVVREVIREVGSTNNPTPTPTGTPTPAPQQKTTPPEPTSRQPLTELDHLGRKPRKAAESLKTPIPSRQSDNSESHVISETEFGLLFQQGAGNGG